MKKMHPTFDGCRLCLDPFAECFTTIDNPQLKDQMDKVFCFAIEPKQGYSSGVCQSCSYAISEFHQYSEKVRQNQEVLNGNVANCDPTIDSKIALESVLSLSDSVLPETIKGVCELKDDFSEGELLTLHSKATPESVKVETLSDSELPETTEHGGEPIDAILEDVPNFSVTESLGSPAEKSQTKRRKRKQSYLKTKREQDEEDQLFNKHFSMICDLCGTSTETFTSLRAHFWKEHNMRYGYVVCCDKQFAKRSVILNHIAYHANPDQLRCEECGKRYTKKDSLIRHKLLMHSSGPLKCDLCPQTFIKKSDLAKHMDRIHEQAKCPQCDKVFANKNSLHNHMKNLHSGKDRTIVCDTCGKGFLCKQNFDRHMNEEHFGTKVKRFQCEICQRWLRTEQTLRYHINCVHNDVGQEVQCDICLRKYPHAYALFKHKGRTHKEPKHECEFCGKKFKHPTSLKEHRLIHADKALFACKYCGRSISRKRNMDKHIERKHPTEWAKISLMETQQGCSS